MTAPILGGNVGENDSLAVKALVEANDLLRDTIARHRRTHAKLRGIIRTLRQQRARILAIAQANDEEFLAVCIEEIYEHETGEGGFPASVSS
jgi:hypothetical protein